MKKGKITKPQTAVFPIRMEETIIEQVRKVAAGKGLAGSSYARTLIYEGLKKAANE